MGHGLTGFNCFAQPYGELAMWLRIKLTFTQGEIVSPGNHAPSRVPWPRWSSRQEIAHRSRAAIGQMTGCAMRDGWGLMPSVDPAVRRLLFLRRVQAHSAPWPVLMPAPPL